MPFYRKPYNKVGHAPVHPAEDRPRPSHQAQPSQSIPQPRRQSAQLGTDQHGQPGQQGAPSNRVLTVAPMETIDI